MYAPAQLPELLPEADFVVLTIPLTAETKHLIGEREFQLMKPSAYLINIGRGGTVDEAALIDALRSGRLAGAGLDVTEQEPLPADSPLWDLENVIITAHYAGATPHYDERALPIFLENLRRYVADEPLINVVDKTLGY
jgi:phosphoglycerate dehydrogenase-like enzyme